MRFCDASGCCRGEGVHRCTGTWTGVTLHQLSLVDLSNPPLQLLWVLGEELELGAVALWVFPGVVVTNFSWKKYTVKQKLTWMFDDDFLIRSCNFICNCLSKCHTYHWQQVPEVVQNMRCGHLKSMWCIPNQCGQGGWVGRWFMGWEKSSNNHETFYTVF